MKLTSPRFICLILVVALSGLTGCASDSEPKQAGPSRMRVAALRSAATAYGARYGLAVQGKLINRALEREKKSLNQIYNFNRMLLPHNVLPPVLVEGRHSLNLADDSTIRLADRIYTIVKPAVFVTAAPTWRDYLYLDFEKPEPPHFTLCPHNAEERYIWDKALLEGWHNGLMQATQIFKANIGKLTRDFKGMALYEVLLSKHMVTPPYVATAKMGITGNGNHLRIGDQILRITVNSSLVPQSEVWKPALAKHSLQPFELNDCNLLHFAKDQQACKRRQAKIRKKAKKVRYYK